MENLQLRCLFLLYFVTNIKINDAADSVCRQTFNTRGRHFLVNMPHMGILLNNSDSYTIHIASNDRGHATVTKFVGSKTTLLGNYFLSGDVVSVNVGIHNIDGVYNDSGIMKNVIEIKANIEVAVYVTGIESNDATGYVAFPTKAASVEYVIPSYISVANGYGKHILVVTSSNDGTNIHVENFLSNVSSSQHTLNQLDSFTLYSSKYTNQAKVISDKPVTVVYVNTGSLIAGGRNVDSMSISPIPVAFWGRQFIVPHMKPKSLSMIRIYAETINTIINIQLKNNTANKNLTFEGFHEVIFGPDALVLLSDKPVNVVQYGISMKYVHNFNDIGDALMASVPAINHFSNNYNFPCPFQTLNFVCRIAITIKSDDMYGLRLDGNNLSSIQHYITAVPETPFNNYRILVLELSNGNHRLEHVSSDKRFSVFLYSLRNLYGLGFYLGYSFTTTERACQNGGTCLDSGSCLCQIGYTGKSCETKTSWINGLTCFSCKYSSSLAFCDSIEHCSKNQTCYHQRENNMNGHTYYKSGCIDKQLCNQYRQETQSSNSCFDCCEESFCNSHGCGDKGFPPKDSRGPLCLDCDNVINPKDCYQITLCSSNEMCRIEELPWGDGSLFHLGCKAKLECATQARTAGKRTLYRSIPICVGCCNEDFCNSNCTREGNNQQAIIG